MRILVGLLLMASAAWGQFDVQNSGTSAGLRGIDSAGAGVAWASGTGGTVIRTEDAGILWQRCTVPRGAETLDFRGVVGFDAQTAVVMASGKGSASRIYRTTDGCQTWKMVFENPDAEGFFDAVVRVTGRQMYLLGDPVGGKFALFHSMDGGGTWSAERDPGLDAVGGGGAFAASNSALFSLAGGVETYLGAPPIPGEKVPYSFVPEVWFGTGGTGGAYLYVHQVPSGDVIENPEPWGKVRLPVGSGTEASGIFSLGFARTKADGGVAGIAVGGDYGHAYARAGTAAYNAGRGTWKIAETLPGGYRSAVAWDAKSKMWLAVGPNGADVSRDDGRDWVALKGDTAAGWNAISLPFVVGPKGRVGRVRDGVLGR